MRDRLFVNLFANWHFRAGFLAVQRRISIAELYRIIRRYRIAPALLLRNAIGISGGLLLRNPCVGVVRIFFHQNPTDHAQQKEDGGIVY